MAPTTRTIAGSSDGENVDDNTKRKFKDFASLRRPLTELLKNNFYKWSNEAQSSFLALKAAMSMVQVFSQPDFTTSFEVGGRKS
ncbi:hypothetical protein Tco_1518862 [Tanacetum coccineum]